MADEAALKLREASRTWALPRMPSRSPGLIGAQRLAAAPAERKRIDPDQPRALSRSVILA